MSPTDSDLAGRGPQAAAPVRAPASSATPGGDRRRRQRGGRPAGHVQDLLAVQAGDVGEGDDRLGA